MRLLRAASLAAATDEERPMVIGEITPGNSTALRSGIRISASSGIGRKASAVERLPAWLSSPAASMGSRFDSLPASFCARNPRYLPVMATRIYASCLN